MKFIKSYKIFENDILIENGEEGNCFMNVVHYAIKECDIKNCSIIHGKVTSQGKTIDHAWIEEGDYAIDPTTGVKTLKSKYYSILNPVVDVVYKLPEALKLMRTFKNYGTWA